MTIERQAAELAKLKGKALHERYREILGAQPKSNNRPYLIRKILHAQQLSSSQKAAVEKTSDREAAQPPELTNGKAKPRRTDPRLPAPGTVLEREYDGKILRAKILEDGQISFKGKTYTSLSKTALAATGTVWNGFLFWKLTKRSAKSAPAKTD